LFNSLIGFPYSGYFINFISFTSFKKSSSFLIVSLLASQHNYALVDSFDIPTAMIRPLFSIGHEPILSSFVFIFNVFTEGSQLLGCFMCAIAAKRRANQQLSSLHNFNRRDVD
jgi:hypothetical protein